LGGGFLADDFGYVARFGDFPWADWPRLFTREWSEGMWGFQLKELRPFAALSFMVDARIWGGNALGYRLTNLALHAGATALVLRLAWRYSRGSVAAACIAALAFALHPAHAEAVAWITGRVDLLATVCALGFWLLAERWTERGDASQLALAGAVFFVALFSKEVSLLAPPLLLLRWVLVAPRASREVWTRRIEVLVIVALVIGIYAVCRYAALGTDAAAKADGWSEDGAWRRQASYLGWLVPLLPFVGRAEWASSMPPALLRGVWLAFAALVVGLIAIVLKWRGTRAAEAFFFTGVWYLVAVGGCLALGYFTPRHLYFATAGLAIGVGLSVAMVCRAGWARATVGVLLVGWCAAAHVVAVRPWQQTGLLSKEITAALNTGFATAPPGTLALVSVPEAIRFAWLWAWASPYALGRPFLERPVHAADVLERAGNYYYPDSWATARQPAERVRAASGAVVLVADRDRRVHERYVTHDELQARVNALAALARDGITSEEWTNWVTTLLKP
jgi:hypothetical protein